MLREKLIVFINNIAFNVIRNEGVESSDLIITQLINFKSANERNTNSDVIVRCCIGVWRVFALKLHSSSF